MSAEHELYDAYEEWRQLAGSEGRAIDAADWGLVAACQTSLRQLQKRISKLSIAARTEWANAHVNPAVREQMLNATVRELIQIEQRNQILLVAAQAAARVKMEQLNEAGRNLKLIRRSYGIHRAAAWTSVI